MICPRCSVAEIAEGSSECQLCGYSSDKNKTVGVLAPDQLDERVHAELGKEFVVERELRRTADSRTYLAKRGAGGPVSLRVFPRAGKSDPALDARVRRAAQVG